MTEKGLGERSLFMQELLAPPTEQEIADSDARIAQAIQGARDRGALTDDEVLHGLEEAVDAGDLPVGDLYRAVSAYVDEELNNEGGIKYYG